MFHKFYKALGERVEKTCSFLSFLWICWEILSWVSFKFAQVLEISAKSFSPVLKQKILCLFFVDLCLTCLKISKNFLFFSFKTVISNDSVDSAYITWSNGIQWYVSLVISLFESFAKMKFNIQLLFRDSNGCGSYDYRDFFGQTKAFVLQM